MTKKIKILYIGLSPNLGGIETYLYNLYKNMDKSKFEVSFLVFKGKKVCFYDELKAEGVKFFEITHRNKNYRQFLKDLKEVYSNNEFDYIHQNLMDFSCFERITYANKYSNAKIIIHSHNAGFGKNIGIKTRILHKIGKHKIKNINYIKLACGKEAGNFFFGVENYIVMNNGIDIKKFSYNDVYRKEIREEFDIDDNTTIIGQVAKLEKQKNPIFLIEIFKEYLKLNSSSKLVIVGEGSLKETILRKIEKYNIKDNVIFMGRREDVYKIYSSFDVFLMPSLYEGLSISLIEAQANGLMCYTSDTVDNSSNITGNVKFLSLNNDAQFWAKEIYNSNCNRDMAVNKKIPSEFYSNNSYKKIMELYLNELDGEQQ